MTEHPFSELSLKDDSKLEVKACRCQVVHCACLPARHQDAPSSGCPGMLVAGNHCQDVRLRERGQVRLPPEDLHGVHQGCFQLRGAGVCRSQGAGGAETARLSSAAATFAALPALTSPTQSDCTVLAIAGRLMVQSPCAVMHCFCILARLALFWQRMGWAWPRAMVETSSRPGQSVEACCLAPQCAMAMMLAAHSASHLEAT